jgi:hypothetical protein
VPLFLSVAGALTAPAGLQGAEPAPQPDQTVPMRFDRILAPFPVVQVRLNGGPPGPFLIDTGFDGQLLIDEQAAARLKLSAKGTEVTIQPGNLKFTEILLDSVQLAGGRRGVDLGLRTAHVGDLSGLQRGFDVAPWGVIGAQALRKKAIRLDFVAGTLTLLGEARPPDPKAGATLALTVKSDAYYVELPLADGVSATLHLDTGSNFSTLPDAVAALLAPSATTSFIHSDVDETLHVSSKMLLPGLQVGPVAIKDVAFSAGSASDALLGTDVLSRFLVTLDFKGKRLFLERPNPRAPLLGATGARMAPLPDGGFEVSFLDEGSPAAKAGVRVGDRLVAADGHRLEKLPSIVAQRLVGGLAGTTAQLQIDRGSNHTAVQVAFKRISEFDQTRGALTGVRLDKLPGETAIVTSVAAGSVAALAGLVAGDTIVAANGVPTSAFRTGQMSNLLVQPEVTLVIQRAREPEPRTLKLKAAR